MEKEHVKYYKTAPKHPYWFNDGNIERVKGNGGINICECINLTTKKKTGAMIRGYRLFRGYKKATELEWKSALANVL